MDDAQRKAFDQMLQTYTECHRNSQNEHERQSLATVMQSVAKFIQTFSFDSKRPNEVSIYDRRTNPRHEQAKGADETEEVVIKWKSRLDT